MKPRLTAALLAAILGSAVSSTANAEMKIQSGVYYDTGKECMGLYDPDPEDIRDTQYCWATAGANAIQFWLDANRDDFTAVKENPDGLLDINKNLPGGTAYTAVYKDLLEKSKADVPGRARGLFDWYFSGKDLRGSNNILVLSGSDGGYYNGSGVLTAEYRWGGNLWVDQAAALKDALCVLQDKGTALVLSLEGSISHNITCWGYEEKNGRVTGLTVTDSDDGYFGALRFDVGYDELGRPYLMTDNTNTFMAYGCNFYHITVTGAEHIVPTYGVNETAPKPQTEIPDNGYVTTGTTLTESTTVRGGLTVGDGTNIVVLSSKDNTTLTVTGASRADAGLEIARGSMVSLSSLRATDCAGRGILNNGSLYVNDGSFLAQNNTADFGGALWSSAYVELVGNSTVSFLNNKATATGAAIYNSDGTVSIRGNEHVVFSGNKAKSGADIFNAKGASINITDNAHVLIQGDGSGVANIVNNGDMYVGVKEGQEFIFRDTTIDSYNGELPKTYRNGTLWLARHVSDRDLGQYTGAVSFENSRNGGVTKIFANVNEDSLDLNYKSSFLWNVKLSANGVIGGLRGGEVDDSRFVTNTDFKFHDVMLTNVIVDMVGAGASLDGVTGSSGAVLDMRNVTLKKQTVLNVYGTGNRASNISGLKGLNLNFMVDGAVKNGSTMLTLSGGANTNLNGTVVRVDVSKAQLNGKASTITLLHKEGGLLQGNLATISVDSKSGSVLNSIATTLGGNSTLVFGSAVTADTNTAALVSVSGNDLVLTLGGTARPVVRMAAAKSAAAPLSLADEEDGLPAPVAAAAADLTQAPEEEDEMVTLQFRIEDPAAQAAEKAALENVLKSIAETRVSAAATVNRTADFMLSAAVDQAKAATAGKHGVAAFSAVGGSNLRYNTGSSVQSNGFNLAAGVAKAFDGLTLGVAGEYATSDFRSHVADISAKGENKLYGGALMLNWQGKGGWHVDGAVRMGRVSSEHNGVLDLEDDAAYQGVLAGAGKSVTLSDSTALDLYARYMFSYTAGSAAKGDLEGLRYDSVASHRSVLGARVNHKVSDKATVYAGAAWMHEYAGDARVSVQGDKSPAPSLGGSSGMLEVGTTLAPFGSERVLLNLNMSGWTGVQRGISGGAGISVSF
ncbi:MAG: autotransporter outer membrane beta-barrel domain-containing protein [Akkermansia sp.]|nr:autotransporter outer membrane beta-barrel domain-containing protein [Akkermansia sp.]